MDVGQAGELLVHAAHAAEAGGGDGAAVVGVLAADDELPTRLVDEVEVAVDQADVGVVGLGTRIGEKDVVEPFRQHCNEALRHLDGDVGRAVEETVVVGQPFELLGDGAHDLRLAVA